MTDGFFGQFTNAGSAAEQLFLWQIIGAIVQTVTGPYLLALQENVNSRHPQQVLAPADLADAVIRNYMTKAEATTEAAKSGLDAARFNTMVPLHGDAPGPQQLVQALLREIIPEQGDGADSASFIQGIREGRLSDKWAAMIKALGDQVISPADAASASVRHFLDPGAAAAEAAKSGVSGELFATLTSLAADAPAPGQLAEALRRGLIPETGTGAGEVSFDQGIAEGRLGDKWTAMIKGLAPEWPSPADALRAALTGQVPPDQAAALYAQWGGDPQWFQIMLNTEGSAPTPLEATQMALRGIIPWTGTGPDATTYEQAFLEGPWRDKWEDPYKQLASRVPTESEITEFLRYGIIDKPTAANQLAALGITGDYATWVLDYAEAVSTFDFRGLTINTVMNALTASIITATEAKNILTQMHVSDQAADLLLSYTQMQRSLQQVTNAISHVGSLYTARKITPDTARASLSQLGLDATAANDIMATWDLEAAITVRTLTEAQIIDAWLYGIMTQDQATTELANIGYTPFDAWVLLSVRAKTALPGEPPQGPPPALPGVIPGST